MKQPVTYAIVSVDPGPHGDEKQLVECFDTKEHAEIVLKALESVNINFNSYQIEPLQDLTWCEDGCRDMECRAVRLH